MYWQAGFEGRSFPFGALVSPEDVRAEPLPWPNVMFSEVGQANNTLSVSTCPAYLNHKGPLASMYQHNTVEPVIAERLKQRLAPAQPDLDAVDILALMDLCTYWTLGSGRVTNGQASIELHPLCKVFEHDEWRIYEYAHDLESYENQGYGSPYHRAAAQGFLRELYARLNGSLPVLNQPTSLNSTLDSDLGTFPLPSKAGHLLFLDAAHSGSTY